MPSANNTASTYVSIVLVFKSRAEKKGGNSFYLNTIYDSSEQNDTVGSVWRQKECLTAAAAGEHI